MNIKTIQMTLACMAFLAVVSSSLAQPIQLITLTDNWRTEQNANLDGVAWNELAYDDSTWRQGMAAFSFNDADNPFIAPLINSTNEDHRVAVGANTVPRVLYYRIHFNYTGNAASSIFAFTNLVDDGVVVYLNGVRIYDLRVDDDPATYATVATDTNPSGGDAEAFEVVELAASSLTSLNAGDNVLAVALYQNSPTSSDSAFTLALVAHEGAASSPVVTSPASDQDVSVIEGASADLTVEATGSPSPTFQWEFSTDSGATFNPLDGETSATYTIDFMATTNVGFYRVIVSNVLGTAISPIFDVILQSDVTPPVLLSACVETNGTVVRTVWSEDIGEIYGQTFVYAVINANDDSDVRTPLALSVSGNEVLLIDFIDLLGGAAPLVEDTDFLINFIVGTEEGGEFYLDPPVIADLFGNGVVANQATSVYLPYPTLEAPVSPTIAFQEGVNGYVGTIDTEIRGNNPTQDNSETTVLNPDGADGNPAFPVNALIRFENIFGGAQNQIPAGATIVSASLFIQTTDGGQGTDNALHRMQTAWLETDNWNSLGMDDGTPGIQPGSEALETATGTASPTTGSTEVFDVTADLQAWATGAEPNNGWAILPLGTDGWDLNSSEAGTPEDRPRLVVCYTAIACTDVPDITEDPADVTVTEPGRVSLSVIAVCGETYQWRKGGVDIPGANGSTYVIDPSVPSDSGEYDVVVGNSFGSVTSAAATVVVNADTIPPTLDSIVADGDAGTITLSFSEPLAVGPAQNTGNYTVSVVGGGSLAVNSAVLQANGTDVVLTTDLPSFDARYTLDISGLTDLAAAPNTIDPITVDPLVVEYLILDWDATWTYTTNGQVEATVPGWEQPGYDDSAWLTGAGLFGLETSGGTPIPNPPGIQTPFTLEDETAAWIHTFYFRRTVNVPIADTSDVTFEFRHLIDDGAVAYIGGQEAFRYNMPEDVTPVTYSNEATDAIEGSMQADGAAMPSGDSLVAIEVHQGNVGSSDVLFGTRIVALVGQEPDPGEATLSITQDNDSVTITWDDPSLILLASPTVDGTYTEVVGATSPHTLNKPLSPDMQYFALGEAP